MISGKMYSQQVILKKIRIHIIFFCMNCDIYIVKYYSKNTMVLLGLMNKSTMEVF